MRFRVSCRAFVIALATTSGCGAPPDADPLPIDTESDPEPTEPVFDLGTGLDLPADATERGRTPLVGRPIVGGEGGGGEATSTVRPESAHAMNGPADLPPGRLGTPATPLAGEPCASSLDCEPGTRCVADTLGSDGEFRCLTVCLDPTADNADAITCLDDDGCCDDGAVCDEQGRCVNPGGGGGGSGGSDPAADGEGCNQGCDFDRDDDGVVNSLDANPDQSCSADSDQDGINDSCDADDGNPDDGCFGCGVSRLRTNGLVWTYAMILIMLRPRRRRHG